MFNKFFGKKNDGFYMQVDESAPPKAAAAAKEAETKSKVDASNEITAKSDVAADTVIEATPKAAAEPKSKSAKTSIKKDNKPENKNKKDNKPENKKDEPAPQPVVAAAPVFTNFATDYLVTPAVAGNRRRPGANMKGFMTMARDVQSMKKGSQGNQIKEKAAKKAEA